MCWHHFGRALHCSTFSFNVYFGITDPLSVPTSQDTVPPPVYTSSSRESSRPHAAIHIFIIFIICFILQVTPGSRDSEKNYPRIRAFGPSTLLQPPRSMQKCWMVGTRVLMSSSSLCVTSVNYRRFSSLLSRFCRPVCFPLL